MKTKQCSKCKEAKLVGEFNKNKSSKDGLQFRCKACRKKYREVNKEAIAIKKKQHYEANKGAIAKKNKQRYEANKDTILKRNKLYRDDNKEAIAKKKKLYRDANKEAEAKRGKKYREANKEALAEYHKQYNKANKEAIAKKNKQYYQDNRDIIINRVKQHHNKRKDTDPVYRMVCSMRTRLSTILRRGSGKDETTMELVGCDLSRLKMHIEAQFTEGMSWDNYGKNGWHCDHIQPVASFDQSCPEQRKQCWHYTNLQPLWWPDNIAKSDKDIGDHQVKLL